MSRVDEIGLWWIKCLRISANDGTEDKDDGNYENLHLHILIKDFSYTLNFVKRARIENSIYFQ